jgi:hypothetical protein
MKLIRLIKVCLNEAYSKICIVKHLSDSFPIQNGLKQGDALSPLLFNFALEYAIGNVQKNQLGLKLNGTHHLLAYADDVKMMWKICMQRCIEGWGSTLKEVEISTLYFCT